MTEWFIDEHLYAGPEHLDPDFVAGFDRKQGSPPVEPDLQVLREHGALTPESVVVDLGTGTGRFAVAAAQHCARVVAVDVSQPMIDHVGRAAALAGVANLDCVHAGFLSYQHVGDRADAVYTRHALHQLPDFWKGIALHRIAAILRRGGVLRLHDLVYDVSPADAVEVLQRWIDGGSPDPAAGYTRADYIAHVRTEFSTYTWLLEPLLEAAGFEIVDRAVGGQVYASYTCVRR